MKKYFAKYLPAEGGIKDKSLVLEKGGSKIGHIIYPDNADGIYHIDFLDGTSGGSDHFELVKFFLCSRDIQVGDKIISQLGEVFIIRDGGDLVSAKLNKYYKIIGEISPDALWVKEGDEFDEEDWRSAKKSDYTYVDYEKEIPLEEGYFAEIKGPCGHFH